MALPTAYTELAAAAEAPAAPVAADPDTPPRAQSPAQEQQPFTPPWRADDASAAAALPSEVKAALDECMASGVFGAAHAAAVDDNASRALVRPAHTRAHVSDACTLLPTRARVCVRRGINARALPTPACG
jgi:hypothetical protein